jgi:hypothetical protein
LTLAGILGKVVPQPMRDRVKVRSSVESHRAKTSHPDRRIYLPQTTATDLEFPATDPANAPARAEFKLGIFPPDHHVPPAILGK